MLDAHAFIASLDNDKTESTTIINDGLQQKLNLYQVFLRLYEHNRSLLDEILELETPPMRGEVAQSSTDKYVQGMILNGQAGIVTNLTKGQTQTIFQPQNIWTIGRDRRKSVISASDDRLSRCHAAIVYQERSQTFYLIDFNSTNGSFINGEQIRKEHVLKDGDRVRLGSLSFVFFSCASMRRANRVSDEQVNFIADVLGEKTEIQPPDVHPCSFAYEGHEQDTENTSNELGVEESLIDVLDETSMFLRP
jgi:pSer/pThr/pTyr-binding forkhead associated (FHA) protein